MFIVFEGIDDSGKTTHAKLLVDYLNENNKKAIYFRAPQLSTRLGNLIYEIVHEPTLWKPSKYLLYLLAADAEEAFYGSGGIKDHLDDEYIVIYDRYFKYSAYAYQYDQAELIKRLSEDLPNPDLFVYLEKSLELQTEQEKKRAKAYQENFPHCPAYCVYESDKYVIKETQDNIRAFVEYKLSERKNKFLHK